MENYAEQQIQDGQKTRAYYDNKRALLAQEITKAQVVGDVRRVVILATRFVDAFPSGNLAPIEKAVRAQFQEIRKNARYELIHKCPVCGSSMYDTNCPDDMVRAMCAKCGRTYTPMGYIDDDNYALKWHATLWDGGSEPKEIIEVQ